MEGAQPSNNTYTISKILAILTAISGFAVSFSEDFSANDFNTKVVYVFILLLLIVAVFLIERFLRNGNKKLQNLLSSLFIIVIFGFLLFFLAALSFENKFCDFYSSVHVGILNFKEKRSCNESETININTREILHNYYEFIQEKDYSYEKMKIYLESPIDNFHGHKSYDLTDAGERIVDYNEKYENININIDMDSIDKNILPNGIHKIRYVIRTRRLDREKSISDSLHIREEMRINSHGKIIYIHQTKEDTIRGYEITH